jgi:hypothetical protein
LPRVARIFFCIEESLDGFRQSLHRLGLYLVRFQKELRLPLQEFCLCYPVIGCFGALFKDSSPFDGMWADDVERAPRSGHALATGFSDTPFYSWFAREVGLGCFGARLQMTFDEPEHVMILAVNQPRIGTTA